MVRRRCAAIMIGLLSAFFESPVSEAQPQHFACDRGLTAERCRSAVIALKHMLDKYPGSGLDAWKWIIVPSSDWKKAMVLRGVDPDSPALTYQPEEKTFFDVALFGGDSLRGAELKNTWKLPVDELLDKAVRHELAHALCKEKNEAKVAVLEDRLRSRLPLQCDAKRAR